MKKIISKITAFMAAALIAMSGMAVSAANGVDLVDSFESYYKKKDLIGMIYKGDGCFKNGAISTDTQNSAPDRGNGKADGNYRSLKATVDFNKDSWGTFRNMTEDSYALIDAINADKDVYLTFWAKADRKLNIYASVDIKDCPFGTYVELTPEWKQYRLKLRDLSPELADKEKNWTNIYERNSKKTWGNGKEEAFLVGFKFGIEAEDADNKETKKKIPNSGNPGVKTATFWIDTLAFEGSSIVERSEENTQDKPGKVPDDFKAEEPTTTTKNPTPPTAGPVVDDKTTVAKTDATVTGGDVTTGTTAADSTTDTTTAVPNGSEDTTTASAPASTPTSSSDANEEQDEGMSTGTKVLIGVAIVVALVGIGAAVYFLVIKKK